MKKLLFKKAFEKAEKFSGKTTKSGLADFLSFKITNDQKFSVSSRTFDRLYERYINEDLDKGNDPKTDLLDAVSKYLDFDNFENFVLENSVEVDGHIQTNDDESKPDFGFMKRIKMFVIKNKIIATIFSLAILTIIGMSLINQPKFMVWQENEYVGVKFNLKKYELSQLKIYKAEWVKGFKQIVPGCGVTKFFNEDNSPSLWYGKSQEGKLEYFTHYGLHPETGKTLKPITDYMIGKYICE